MPTTILSPLTDSPPRRRPLLFLDFFSGLCVYFRAPRWPDGVDDCVVGLTRIFSLPSKWFISLTAAFDDCGTAAGNIFGALGLLQLFNSFILIKRVNAVNGKEKQNDSHEMNWLKWGFVLCNWEKFWADMTKNYDMNSNGWRISPSWRDSFLTYLCNAEILNEELVHFAFQRLMLANIPDFWVSFALHWVLS